MDSETVVAKGKRSNDNAKHQKQQSGSRHVGKNHRVRSILLRSGFEEHVQLGDSFILILTTGIPLRTSPNREEVVAFGELTGKKPFGD